MILIINSIFYLLSYFFISFVFHFIINLTIFFILFQFISILGLKAADGIVLAAERRVVSKLLAPSKTSEKTYTLDGHLTCLVAGLNADANILIQQSRQASQR